MVLIVSLCWCNKNENTGLCTTPIIVSIRIVFLEIYTLHIHHLRGQSHFSRVLSQPGCGLSRTLFFSICFNSTIDSTHIIVRIAAILCVRWRLNERILLVGKPFYSLSFFSQFFFLLLFLFSFLTSFVCNFLPFFCHKQYVYRTYSNVLIVHCKLQCMYLFCICIIDNWIWMWFHVYSMSIYAAV